MSFEVNDWLLHVSLRSLNVGNMRWLGVIETKSDAEKKQRYQLTGISSDGCRLFGATHYVVLLSHTSADRAI